MAGKVYVLEGKKKNVFLVNISARQNFHQKKSQKMENRRQIGSIHERQNSPQKMQKIHNERQFLQKLCNGRQKKF